MGVMMYPSRQLVLMGGVVGVEHAWRLILVDPGGFEWTLDMLEQLWPSWTSADRPNTSADSLGRRGSCGAPFARSWEAEAKEGVGCCQQSEVRLVIMPADVMERWGSCGGFPCMASPSKSERVVAESSRRRGAVSSANHDTAAAEACYYTIRIL